MRTSALKYTLGLLLFTFFLCFYFLTFAEAASQLIGPTKICDDLWQLAKKARPAPDITVQQTVIGLWQKNPEAFYVDNINGLKAGYYLIVPTVIEAQQYSPSQAIQMMTRQNKEWEAIAQQLAENPTADYLQAKQTKCVPEEEIVQNSAAQLESNTPPSAEIGSDSINHIVASEAINTNLPTSSSSSADNTTDQLTALQNQVAQLTQTVKQLQQANQDLITQLEQVNSSSKAEDTTEEALAPPAPMSSSSPIITFPSTLTNPFFSERFTAWHSAAINCQDLSCQNVPLVMALPAQGLFDDQALQRILQIQGIELLGIALLLLILFLLMWYEVFFLASHTRISSANAQSDSNNPPISNSQISTVAGDNVYDTKLDLARAYIDMEDWESAKRLLENVIEEGSSGQRIEAQSLLKNIRAN